MAKTLVFGHKNPDTDSICSAIVYADLKKALGVDAEAVRLGEINKETEYVLNYVGIEPPKFIDNVPEDVEQVILVDHNEFQQSVDNIKDKTIVEVIDHHRIANFETPNPLYFRAEPVGCTATILYKLFNENDVAISKENALLLVSAIVSDTLLFKSPTCTEEDKKVAEELAKIAGIDLETYGLDMLKAGTNLGDKTVEEILSMDAKEFTMSGSKVEIAQVNVVDPETARIRDQRFHGPVARDPDGDGDGGGLDPGPGQCTRPYPFSNPPPDRGADDRPVDFRLAGGIYDGNPAADPHQASDALRRGIDSRHCDDAAHHRRRRSLQTGSDRRRCRRCGIRAVCRHPDVSADIGMVDSGHPADCLGIGDGGRPDDRRPGDPNDAGGRCGSGSDGSGNRRRQLDRFPCQ